MIIGLKLYKNFIINKNLQKYYPMCTQIRKYYDANYSSKNKSFSYRRCVSAYALQISCYKIYLSIIYLFTVDENIIGAHKMQNIFCFDIKLLNFEREW